MLTALDSAECAMSDSQVLETSIANVAASQDRGQVTLVLAKDLLDDKEGVSLCNFFFGSYELQADQSGPQPEPDP